MSDIADSEEANIKKPKASISVLSRNLDFLESLHKDESDRHGRLSQLAAAYFGVEGLYIGAVAFKFADIIDTVEKSGVPMWIFIAALLVVISALGFTALAVAIKVGEGLADSKTVFDRLERDPEKEDVFLLQRCADYAVATNINVGINDRRANWLQIAGYFIFVSVLLHILGIVLAVIKNIHFC